MIIKVLFAILALSLTALIGVAIAVFVRVRWQFKSRRAEARRLAEEAHENSHQHVP